MNHAVGWYQINKDGVTVSEFLKKRIWILDPHGIRQPVVLGVTASRDKNRPGY